MIRILRISNTNNDNHDNDDEAKDNQYYEETFEFIIDYDFDKLDRRTFM